MSQKEVFDNLQRTSQKCYDSVVGQVSDYTKRVTEVYPDVVMSGYCISWETFTMFNRKYILENIKDLVFPGGHVYPDVFKSSDYLSLYGVRGHPQHNLLRCWLDNQMAGNVKKIPVSRTAAGHPIYSFVYTFKDVTRDSFMATEGKGDEVVLSEDITYKVSFMEWDAFCAKFTLPMLVPPGVVDILYDREKRRAVELMAKVGFRDANVYSLYPWCSSLFSYCLHGDLAKKVNALIVGRRVLSVCDAIGLIQADENSDLNPSPYSLKHVKRRSISEVLLSWTDETLVVMFGSTFFSSSDWDIVNSSNSPCIFVDVVSVPFVGSQEISPGITARQIETRTVLQNPEAHLFKDPYYTENLLKYKKTFYIVSDGNALRYLVRMVPNMRFSCSERLFSFLSGLGINAVVEDYDSRAHTYLLETFEEWKKFKKGYFVPAGRDNTPVFTLRHHMALYESRVIYRVSDPVLISSLVELGVSVSSGSSPGSAHFVFPRTGVYSTFSVVDYAIRGLTNVVVYDVHPDVIVYSSFGPGLILSAVNKKQFRTELTAVRSEFGSADYYKIVQALESCTCDNVRRWAYDYA